MVKALKCSHGVFNKILPTQYTLLYASPLLNNVKVAQLQPIKFCRFIIFYNGPHRTNPTKQQTDNQQKCCDFCRFMPKTIKQNP